MQTSWQIMVFEQKDTHDLLRSVVRRLTREKGLQEDLIQEALIHLWMREAEHPGQKRSWYIQSCRLHLQNVLRKGRSVDCRKHRHASGLSAPDEQGPEEFEPRSDETLLSLVCARDLMAELSKWLTPVEKEILNLSNEGLSAREIGQRLALSHTSVIRRRRNIAILAGRLGNLDLRAAGEREAASQGKGDLPSNGNSKSKVNGKHTNHTERNHETQEMATTRTNT